MTFTSDQLKEGFLGNNPEAFRYAYRTYGGMIAGFVRKNNGTEHDAEEMVQIVLLELWTAFREGRYSEEGKLDRFVYILTANRWKDELRKRKVRQTSPLEYVFSDPTDESENSLEVAIVKDQRIEAIHYCMSQLGAPCDELIKLFHLEDVSLQSLADRFQYDYNNLRKRIFDCRKKLKKLVDQYLAKQL